MRSSITRKTPHFFVVNPIRDRRNDVRYETKEAVDVRALETGEFGNGETLDIQKKGLRFESARHFDAGTRIQLTFPKTPDNTGCFGRIAWVRPNEFGKGFLCGVEIESWFGVVQGPDSWKRFKGVLPKHDRRQKPR